MKHGIEHYISKGLNILWFATLIIGSLTLFIFISLLFLKVIGVL